jgi:putative endonuclease
MIYTVYILYSLNFQKHYTGFTSNLEQRILSHNELGKDWTSKYRPWKIIFTKEFENKKEEWDMKNGLNQELVEYMYNHYNINHRIHIRRKGGRQFKSASRYEKEAVSKL